MIDLRDVLERLLQRRDLPESEAGALLVALTDPRRVNFANTCVLEVPA